MAKRMVSFSALDGSVQTCLGLVLGPKCWIFEMATATHIHQSGTAQRGARFCFVLFDQFTLLSFAGAVEVLRHANRTTGTTLYDWRLLSVDGAPVQSSSGVVLTPEAALDTTRNGETVILCGGLDVQRKVSPALLSWLRREVRRGARVGALCTATIVLARAGLLDGRPATVHWENYDALAEDFSRYQPAQIGLCAGWRAHDRRGRHRCD